MLDNISILLHVVEVWKSALDFLRCFV